MRSFPTREILAVFLQSHLSVIIAIISMIGKTAAELPQQGKKSFQVAPFCPFFFAIGAVLWSYDSSVLAKYSVHLVRNHSSRRVLHTLMPHIIEILQTSSITTITKHSLKYTACVMQPSCVYASRFTRASVESNVRRIY